MGNIKLTYADYLASTDWQMKRNERLRMDNFTCQKCGAKKNLEIHHLTYKNIFNENVETDLITLCDHCHEELENGKYVKELEDRVEWLEERYNELSKKRMEEHTNSWKAESDLQNKIWETERDLKNLTTANFINRIKCRDTSFGGIENCCDRVFIEKALKDFGIEKESINLGAVYKYFGMARRILLVRYREFGLSLYEAATAADMSDINKAKKAWEKDENYFVEEFFRAGSYPKYKKFLDFNNVLNINKKEKN